MPIEADPYISIVEEAAPGVHYMRQPIPNFAGVVGNVVVIEQEESVVLVDSASAYGGGVRVVDTVRAITSKPVSNVIITHWHNDHPLGLPAIVEAWPDTSVISTVATFEHLRGGRTNAPLQNDANYDAQRFQVYNDYMAEFESLAADPGLSQSEREGWARAVNTQLIRIDDQPGTHLVLPTRTFTDTLTLDDPGSPVQARFLGRANTDGDLVVWLSHQKVLITGDIVVAPTPYMFSVYPTENIATLELVREYDFEVLIPGHGEMQRDKAYVDLLIEFIGAARGQVAPLAEQGLTLEEVTARVQLEEFGERFVGDDPWLLYWYRDYSLEPLIESIYNETTGRPLGPQ
ncbi:MAG TPA: MBL fold metallo-hydrolase [Acidimicrobiia bacterium]|nr:MBL fold metallo-hydrolase [Acidimicrobiia bacterium]